MSILLGVLLDKSAEFCLIELFSELLRCGSLLRATDACWWASRVYAAIIRATLAHTISGNHLLWLGNKERLGALADASLLVSSTSLIALGHASWISLKEERGNTTSQRRNY